MFAPTLVQSKAVLLNTTEEISQLSVLPLLISAAVILAFPVAFNWIVLFCVNTIGATLSSKVTKLVAVDTFPFTSVTVKVTVFGPTFSHVKAVWLKVIVAIAQLSELPLLMSAAVMLAFPAASN